MSGAEKVVATAVAEIGYLEKKSNAQLDDKTANAGRGNFNKYARDLDAIGTIFNGEKNGYEWCAVFVTWCYVQTFGVEMAQKLLCQVSKGLAAGVRFAAKYFKQKGQFHTSGPKPGDQIFFYGSDPSIWQHTGLVEKVADGKVYTIEGNTSRASGVINNGGGVARKRYPVNYNRIAGYGRPDWSLVDGANSDEGTAVLYQAKITAPDGLHCRTSPVSGAVVKLYPCDAVVTVSREKGGWGFTGEGWVSLAYVQKLEDPQPQKGAAPTAPGAPKPAPVQPVPPQPTPAAAERKAAGIPQSFDSEIAGVYAVTATGGLHVRDDGNLSADSLAYLPLGTKVHCYGYYTVADGVKWLYVQATYDGVKYTGFSGSQYLEKQ